MVRTDTSLSLTIENTTSSDVDVKLFKLGASDETTFTNRGAGSESTDPIKASVYNYTTEVFQTQVTLQVRFADGTTTADISIQAASTSQLEQSLAGFTGGTWTITAGADPQSSWLWFCEGPDKAITDGTFRVSGVVGDNLVFAQVPAQLRSDSGIVIRSNPDYNFINESQTGAPIEVFTLDIETTNSSQIKEIVRYSRRDINGNEKVLNCTPTIDPYQYIGSSLLNVNVTGFKLDGNTQVIYTIKANATVKLSLNYMTLRNCDLFKGAIRQRVAVERMRLLETTEKTDRGLKKVLVTPH